VTLSTVPRYDGPSSVVGDRAVVVGASVSGLLAARVLADAFESVTVIDRDSLPTEPVPRRGVPQSAHAHLMIDAGRVTVDDLFPSLSEDLLAAGALQLDASRDLNAYVNGDFLEFEPLPSPLYTLTRPLFEAVVRDSLDAFERVEIRAECPLLDYRFDEDAGRVTGVRCGTAGAAAEIPADLVVDATGRASRTPRWLTRHGYAAPEVDEVTIDLAYTTAMVERPPSDRRAYFLQPDPPRTRGCFVFPVEGDRWIVTMNGMHGDHAPTDPAGFVEYARGLPVSDVCDLLEANRMVGEEALRYPFPASRRNRYWDLDEFPSGLLVVGDAVSSFNPIYGQGMSVAALESLLLHHELADGGLDGLWERYVSKATAVVETAWLLSVGADFKFPQTTGPKPRGVDLFGRYVDRIATRAHSDGVLSRSLREVLMMDKPATSLLAPGVLWRVFGPA